MRRVSVGVIGAGPIGLAIAADLGRRGIDCTVFEQGTGEIAAAKMMLVSVRSMEYCRRLGIAKEISDWGFPPDHPLDNVFLTSLNGFEIGRIRMPTMGEYRSSRYSPEAQVHCPQTIFDPVLKRRATSFPNVRIIYRSRLEGLEQNAKGVRADLRNLDSGSTESVVCDYLVGADGYASTVRKLLGVQMRGEELLDNSINIELVIPELSRFHDKGNAGRYVLIGPEGTWATFIAVDGRGLWRITLYCAGGVDPTSVDLNASIERAIGRNDVPYEVKSVGYWVRRAVVADRFQDGRVLLAGDAAHTHPPNGGLGMNTGLGDAENLSWKLAAMIQGWGQTGLLRSYDEERRPACHRAMSESLASYRRLTGGTALKAIAEAGPSGERSRRELGEKVVSQNTLAFLPVGIHLGLIYDPSPIVVPDGTPRPQDDAMGYLPSSRPGGRAPHGWIARDRSTLDLFGEGYTLLRFGHVPSDSSALLRSAAWRRVPITVFDIPDPNLADLYEHRLALVRPDGFVAWRGSRIPADPNAIVDRIVGSSSGAACWNEAAFEVAAE
jgi:2-polyprenyl-6-methoxyphenol hydroxylase-like FAD-dependent oxidoreductase